MDGAPAHPWDAAAQGWDRHSEMLGAWLAQATEAMLDAAAIGPGARVLDVAAGAGSQTLDIARRVGPAGQVLATDISPRILALARDRLHCAGQAQVATRVADAQALGMDGGGFDAAVSRLGLMFCARPEAALGGMLQALRPGGRLAVLVFDQPAANPIIATMAATAQRHAGGAPTSPFQPGGLLSLGRPGLLAGLLAQCGFSEAKVRPLAAPMQLPSVRHYTDFVRSAGLPIIAMLAPLSPEAQRAAWDDIEAQLNRYSHGGGWTGPNQLLLATASRPLHVRA